MKKAELRSIIDKNLIPLLPKSKKAVLWELPYHTNLGDVLIWQGEECFLADNDIKVIDRNSYQLNDGILHRRIDGDTTIFLHGGGNFGDIWDGPMDFRRKVIARFTENPIILFPQTVFYQDQELAEKDAKLFAKHKNLTLCARDKFSYDFLKKYFFANNILMAPDMAFCINETLLETGTRKTSKNLFGARIDKELNPSIDYKKYLPKLHETTDWPSFEHPPKEFAKTLQMIQENDKSADDYAFRNFMPEMVKMGVDFLSQYSGIFSTRLHIAILSVLLDKKVTWFDNSYGKNSDFYDTWLKNDENIKFVYGDLLKKDSKLSFNEKLMIKRNIQKMADLQKTPLVSVIVPVYNVESYLNECIESITSQTYKNLEILLVDDKTPDKSGIIADEWAEKDKRIKVIHKPKNEGLNMARKTGFDASQGQYITFLDSDDYFHKDNIERSLSILLDNNADIAIYGYKEFSDSDKKGEVAAGDFGGEVKIVATKMNIAEYAFYGGGNLPGIQYMTVWGKIYARRIVERVDWSAANYRLYEDNFWTPQAVLGAKKIVLLSDPLLFYRRNVAYGANGDNLGNRMAGNSINGQPVGYIEYVESLRQFHHKLARDCGFDAKLDERINEQAFLGTTWRIDNLVRAKLLESENNMKYVLEVLPKYIEAKNKHIENLNASINHLDKTLVESKENLNRVMADLERLNRTFEEFRGIKRSARLLAGNIKRKFTETSD